MAKLPSRQDLRQKVNIGSPGVSRLTPKRADTPSLPMPNLPSAASTAPDLGPAMRSMAASAQQTQNSLAAAERARFLGDTIRWENAEQDRKDIAKAFLVVGAGLGNLAENQKEADDASNKVANLTRAAETEAAVALWPTQSGHEELPADERARLQNEFRSGRLADDVKNFQGTDEEAAEYAAGVLGYDSKAELDVFNERLSRKKKEDKARIFDANTQYGLAFNAAQTNEEKTEILQKQAAMLEAGRRSGALTTEQHATMLNNQSELAVEAVLAMPNGTIADNVSGRVGAKAMLSHSESGGSYSPPPNPLLYLGRWQVGAPRLTDLGVYTAGKGEDTGSRWGKLEKNGGLSNSQKWTGKWSIPGFEKIQSKEDYVLGPMDANGHRDKDYAAAAQDTVMELQLDHTIKNIKKKGFDRHVGTEFRGVKVTMEGLIAGIHLGGERGMEKFFAGKGDANDLNGTRISDYMRAGAQHSLMGNINAKGRIRLQQARVSRLGDAVTEAEGLLAKGAPVGTFPQTRALYREVQSVGDKKLNARINEVMLRNGVVQGVRNQKLLPVQITDQINILEAEQARDNRKNWSEHKAIQIDELTKVRDKANKDITENRLGYFNDLGRYNQKIERLDIKDPKSIQQRIAFAIESQKELKGPFVVMQPGEAAAFTSELKEMPLEDRIKTLSIIGSAAKEKAHYFINEMSGDSPEIAAATRVMAQNDALMPVARQILRGMNQEKIENEKERTGAINEVLGDVGRSNDFIRKEIEAAASAYYNSNNPTEFDLDLYKDAVQKVIGQNHTIRGMVGGIGEFHGSKVILPTNQTERELGANLKHATNAGLAAASVNGQAPVHRTSGFSIAGEPTKPIAFDVRELDGAFISSVGINSYAISMNDPNGPNPDWIMNANPITATPRTGAGLDQQKAGRFIFDTDQLPTKNIHGEPFVSLVSSDDLVTPDKVPF